MTIDLMSNNVPLDSDIEAESLNRLNNLMPPREREKLAAAELAALHAQVDAEEAKDKADRDLLAEVLVLEEDERVLAEADLDPAEYPQVDEYDAKGKKIGKKDHPAIAKQKERKAVAMARRPSKAATDLATARKAAI